MIHAMLLTNELTEEVIEEVEAGWEFLQELPDTLMSLAIRVLLCIVIFLVGMKLISFIRKFVGRTLERGKATKEVVQFLDSAIKYGLYFVLITQIAVKLGVDAASIATMLGSAAVAIGLAFQGSLSNCIGGVLILFLKPFKVGDYIIESETNLEGIVSEITIFYTKLTTIDNKLILVPNGTLADTSITNVTNEEYRRLEIKVGISYDSDIRTAKQVLNDLLDKEERVCQDKDRVVYVDELGDSSIVVGLRAWTKTLDLFPVKWKMLEDIKYAFDEAGVHIPYPQMDVHIQPAPDAAVTTIHPSP